MTESRLKINGTSSVGWCFYLGFVIFIVGFISPLFIPLVTSSNFPVKWKAIISGVLAIGIPEIFGILAIAIMGKAGFNCLKKCFFSIIKKYGPPDRVSPNRYRIGLVMFMLPFIFGWLVPYAPQLIPGYEAHRFFVNITGDLMLFTSMFVLGGDFWDKVRALFIQGKKSISANRAAITKA